MNTIKVINKSNNPLPKFETPGAAGADIRADFSRIREYPIKVYGGAEVITSGEGHNKIMVKLSPHSRALIPTGLFMAIPEGYELQIRPRSGLSLKEGLSLANCTATIDSDYRGEVGIIMLNTSNEDRFIEDGERIAQIILKKVDTFVWEKVDKLSETTRGEGGFGHTNKN
jgi:dUTP pyrophosphatase